MHDLLVMCYEFFLIGVFAVGGGLATIPFLQQMSANHPQWFDTDMLMNMVAVSEATPGPLGINMATFIGYQVNGVPGAILASLSLVAPALCIIIPISVFLAKFHESKLVKDAFSTLRPATVGLIASAGFTLLAYVLLMDQNGQWSPQWVAICLFVALFALSQWKHLSNAHPIVFILLGAVASVLLNLG